MIVAPAVDVRGGRCVQLVGGDPSHEAVSLDDPVAAARGWRAHGFATLHVVDLDAALDHGDNRDAIERIFTEAPGDVQVGGGIRSDDDVAYWLERGASRVIVGTRAVNDPEWALGQAEAYPGQIIVAADVRDGTVLRRGWTDASEWTLLDFLQRLEAAPIGGVLITDVGREGQLVGVDQEWTRSLVERPAAGADRPRLLMSGGVADASDVRALADLGVDGVVIGMALYTGRIDPNELQAFKGGFPT